MDTKLMMKPHKDSSRVIPSTDQKITVDKLRMLLPKNTSIQVTEEIVGIIHRMGEDVDLPQETLEEDVMSFTHMLDGMRGVGMKDLVNAVKYCNLKQNYENKAAWAIVFPERYAKLVEGNKQIDNHVSMYNRNKLVTMISTQMLVPTHIIYSRYFDEAVKKQFQIMQGKACLDVDGKPMTVSPMVQHLAAKELAVLTKAPEENKLSISINPGEAAMSALEEMNAQVTQLAKMQRSRLNAGESIDTVQKLGIDFGEITDAEIVK